MKQCKCSEDISGCGCCTGVESLTPQATANRPGLNALRYRIGTHSTFFETMQARLSNFQPENSDGSDNASSGKKYPLRDLKTHLLSDPAISLLSGAAVMLDVLSFYQERLANEGFLRTATERRSVLELGRLVGYIPRPGVSASVYLAYTLDDKADPVEITAGALAQSIPLPNELPQTFETSEKLAARKEWNELRPRLSQPAKIEFKKVYLTETIYLQGTDTRLKLNDPLLFVFRDVPVAGTISEKRLIVRRVQSVEPDYDSKVTRITLQSVPPFARRLAELLEDLMEKPENIPFTNESENLRRHIEMIRQNIRLGSYPRNAGARELKVLKNKLEIVVKSSGNSIPKALKTFSDEFESFASSNQFEPFKETAMQQISVTSLFRALLEPPSRQPANSLQLGRAPGKVFTSESDIRNQLLINFNPDLAQTLYPALASATRSIAQPELQAVYALRVTAPLFGYNAPLIAYQKSAAGIVVPLVPPADPQIANEADDELFLDNAYEKIAPDEADKASYIIVVRDDTEDLTDTDSYATRAFQITDAQIRPRTDYGLSGKTTRLRLDGDWRTYFNDKKIDFSPIRQTTVYTQSEPLALADEPLTENIGSSEIELDRLYDGLQSGRWIIVSGERADIPGGNGIMMSELAMLAGTRQSLDTHHTTLQLAGQNSRGESGLQYQYKRGTVKIYGNVVKATHGETRREVLGSGNAAQALQTFVLKQPPLTFVSAPTASGVASTLQIRVNDIEWRETENLAELNSQDRCFTTKISDEAQTSITFGNGVQGARLPTGIENIKAVYRSGIGKGGNVKAGQISLPLTKPLGVKEVVNPLRASGGADKETRDQARRNVPVALLALDRLVSTSDYANFARTFAGIGKASATRLSNGVRQLVHLTIAGAEDIPIDLNSDLYQNLRRALAKYGVPDVPVQIASRELLALVVVANVSLLADYLWEAVAPKIRTALVDAFSFERRELGQSVFLSEVIGVIQGVEGVAYTDIDVFDSISETELGNSEILQEKLKQLRETGKLSPFVRARSAVRNPDYNGQAEVPEKTVKPAQLAYITPDVPDTLILNKIEEVKK